MSEIKLMRKDFRRYLESVEPDSIAGFGGDDCECPIARWISSCIVPDSSVGVGQDTWGHESEEYYYCTNKLPRWAVSFVKTVDKMTSASVKGITAAQALEVLDQCQ